MLSACFAFTVFLGVSCAGNGASGPTFNEEYLAEVKLGDPITLDEYINPNLTNDYSAILTSKETGEEIDLKAVGQWTTSYAGEFELKYTVNSGDYRGTATAKITVVVPEIKWVFTRNTIISRVGETIYFSQLERDLNVSVTSYYNYTFFVKSVKFGDRVQDLTSETEYTFENEGNHTFTFAIKTEDGQERSAEQIVTVRPKHVLGEGAEEWLESNGISAYDYKYIGGDGQVTLEEGYYNRSFMNDNVPYIAFNGDFGADNYVMVEFTGKNLPQVAFFCDRVTPSITDGGKGLYLHNGLTYTDGRIYKELDASRLTVFGLNKVSYGEFDNRGRFVLADSGGSVAEPCPLSYLALKDDCKYRYIVGFTGATKSSVKLCAVLVNLTTWEREMVRVDELKRYSVSGGNIYVDFTDYFHGSIILYGRYGHETKLDKVYPLVQSNSILDLDHASEFKQAYKSKYDLGSVAKVSDYIDIPQTDYGFTVTDPDGKNVSVSATGEFRYEKSGTYRLTYDSKQENVRKNSITVEVMFDPDEDMGDDYFEIKGAITSSGVKNGTVGLISNTNSKFIEEGKRSIRYYTNDNTSGGDGIPVGISRKLLEFVFLSSKVGGLCLDVYSPRELSYKLYSPAKATNPIKSDYTGTIPAETWTTLTITRDIYMANRTIYSGKDYALAISFYAEEELLAQSSIYIDNIKLVTGGNVKTITDAAQEFLSENDIEVYEQKSVNDDLSVELYDGMYQGSDTNIRNDDVPYVAYKGDFGAGSYVAVDFTGKNVPQLCFFVKDITPSLTDGLAGVYIHTGLTRLNGNYYTALDCGRVTFFGPNKVEYGRIDSSGRYSGQFGGEDEPSPLSLRGLVDGVRYRYVAGIKSVESGKVTLELLLINLDAGEEVVRYTRELVGAYFNDKFATGNIVMYGRYNAAITLDKIYAVYKNVESVYEIDVVAAAIAR